MVNLKDKLKQPVRLTSGILKTLHPGQILIFSPDFNYGPGGLSVFRKDGIEPNDRVKYIESERTEVNEDVVYLIHARNITGNKTRKRRDKTGKLIDEVVVLKKGRKIIYHYSFFKLAS